MDEKLDYVQAELKRRTGQLETVAKSTGISRRTIGYALKGRDIRSSTLNELYEYLKANQRKKILIKGEEKK